MHNIDAPITSISTRVAFQRWSLCSIVKTKEEHLRRGRLKLKVGMDRVHSERLGFQNLADRHTKTQQLFAAYAAVQQWKQYKLMEQR